MIRLWGAMLALLLGLTASADTLRFGIVPQQTALRTIELWGPVADYLSQATGHQITIATAKDIPTFEQNLAAGEYDIAYMNPYHFTVFHESVGYQAIAHRAGQGIRGVIVVREDSEIDSIQQLNGKVIAFPAPAAFAATLVTGAELRQAGVQFEPGTPSHTTVSIGRSVPV